MNQHGVNSDSYYFSNDGSTSSFDDNMLTSESTVFFKPIKILAVAVVELVLCVLFLGGIYLAPPYCNNYPCRTSAFSTTIYLHVGLWGIFMICDQYFLYRHENSRRHGYLQFFVATKLLRRIPFYAMSLWNALLLVISEVLHDHCEEYGFCSGHTGLSKQNYLQIIITLEMFILIPSIICYCVKVIKFNKEAPLPDVQHDSSYVAYESHVSDNDIAVGYQEPHLEDTVEKQAELIEHYKERNKRLSHKIYELTTELNRLQQF